MPIFDFESGHPFKLAGVAGDECEIVCQRDTSNQGVYRANGRAQPLQMGSGVR